MKQGRKRSGILQIIGGIVFAAGMSVIIPKIIEKGSDILCSINHSSKKLQDCDDWGPEIVRKNLSEVRKNGNI